MDIVFTPDPEIEIEEIEKSKILGNAEENDIFKDLTLYELLNSTTDDTSYIIWFIEHVKKLKSMLCGGMQILGIYAYTQDEGEFEYHENISKIS